MEDINAKKRILLVEDQILIALAEKMALEREGYRVIHAQSGEEAIKIAEDGLDDLDLVLMDIDLGPGMDGTDAARRILAKRDLPVIFLSAHVEKEIVDRTEAITSYGYVVKTAGITVLAASIKMAFRLFEANRLIREQARRIEKSNDDLSTANEELQVSNEELQDTIEELQETSLKLETVNTELSRRNDELVEHQRALALSEEKFAKAFRLSPDSIIISRLSDGALIDINKGFIDIMGYSLEEVAHRSSMPDDIGIWVRAEDRKRLIAGLLADGEVTGLEAEFRRKDGMVITGLLSAKVIELYGEKCILSITRDITERKRVDDALRGSEARFRNLMDLAAEAIFLGDHDGVIIEANDRACGLTGYSRAALVGAHLGKLFSRSQLEATPFRFDLLQEGKTVVSRRDLERADGSSVPVEMHSKMMPDGSYQTFLRDMSERRRFEEAQARLIAQKETLLKELQHRVKNNLTIVSGLLGLGEGEVQDEAARRILHETQGRIASIAAVYERLYLSQDLAGVELDIYLMDLAESILSTWNVGPGRIRLATAFEPLSLDTKRAVPLGLVVNELITNVLKYAYPDSGEGELRISLEKDGGRVTLTLSDDGVGLPAGFDPNSAESMGMRLVMLLVDQVKGEFRIESRRGTKASVSFEL